MSLMEWIKKVSKQPTCSNCGRIEHNGEYGWYCDYCTKCEYTFKSKGWNNKTTAERKGFFLWVGFNIGDFVEVKGVNNPAKKWEIIGYTPEATQVIVKRDGKQQRIDPAKYIPTFEIKPRNEIEARQRQAVKYSKDIKTIVNKLTP